VYVSEDERVSYVKCLNLKITFDILKYVYLQLFCLTCLFVICTYDSEPFLPRGVCRGENRISHDLRKKIYGLLVWLFLLPSELSDLEEEEVSAVISCTLFESLANIPSYDHVVHAHSSGTEC
jgi:hypothetical protein